MTLLAAGVLALGAAASASPRTVAGTRWTLARPAAWSEAERAALDEVAAGLPAPLREARVRLVRGDAPVLPTDLATPHTVVRPGAGGLVVGVGGLEARVGDRVAGGVEVERAGVGSAGVGSAEAAAGASAVDADVDALAKRLLARQLVHGLVHRLDERAGWSRGEAWRALSGWDLVGGPAEEDTLSFASPHGRVSAREDLATVAELAYAPGAVPGEAGAPARCRLPSKWRFVEARLGPPAEDGARCASLAEVGLDPDAIEAIEVLYARASARSPASLVGHSLVGVVYAPTATTPRRTDVYELVALTEGAKRDTLGYVLRGLSGGFGSHVQREPLRFAVLRYARENRGVQRFRLRLDEAQERALLTRLDELRQGWARPYLFLERNCTHLPRELVEAAVGEELGLPRVYGPDALFGEMERRGLLEPQPARSLEEHSAQDRAAVAARLRDEAADVLIAARPDLPLADAFADTRARDAADRARGYAVLGAIAEAGSAELGAALLRYLAWSDQIENLRFARFGLDVPDDDPAVRALWGAMAAARVGRAAGDVGAAAAADPTGDAAIMALLAGTARRGTTHTPLGRMEVGSVATLRDGAVAPGLSVGSQVYGFEMGEARRYAAATGTAIALLPWELRASVAAEPVVEARAAALRLRRIVGVGVVGNPGYYATLGDVALRTAGGSALTGLDGGLALELWQHDEHRHHVGLSAGVALGAGDYADAGWRGAVGLPLRLFARLGSATQALTALELDAAWRPTWTVDGAWSDAEARLGGRVRVGEIAGVDVALAADWRVGAVLGDGPADARAGSGTVTGAGATNATFPGFGPLSHEVQLGVWFEPN